MNTMHIALVGLDKLPETDVTWFNDPIHKGQYFAEDVEFWYFLEEINKLDLLETRYPENLDFTKVRIEAYLYSESRVLG